MPVASFINSAGANEALRTPRSFRTQLFTSSLAAPGTTQAASLLVAPFPRTMIVLHVCSSGYPYFSQNAAVAEKAGRSEQPRKGRQALRGPLELCHSSTAESRQGTAVQHHPQSRGGRRGRRPREPSV